MHGSSARNRIFWICGFPHKLYSKKGLIRGFGLSSSGGGERRCATGQGIWSPRKAPSQGDAPVVPVGKSGFLVGTRPSSHHSTATSTPFATLQRCRRWQGVGGMIRRCAEYIYKSRFCKSAPTENPLVPLFTHSTLHHPRNSPHLPPSETPPTKILHPLPPHHRLYI